MSQERPLEVRLTEYRDSLADLASQMEAVARLVEKPQEITEGVRLYRLIADDLTKILRGEELKEFMVTGELP